MNVLSEVLFALLPLYVQKSSYTYYFILAVIALIVAVITYFVLIHFKH